jgi:hypothetical protein
MRARNLYTVFFNHGLFVVVLMFLYCDCLKCFIDTLSLFFIFFLIRLCNFRYNPYVQARSRIDQLKRLGHSVDKVCL